MIPPCTWVSVPLVAPVVSPSSIPRRGRGELIAPVLRDSAAVTLIFVAFWGCPAYLYCPTSEMIAGTGSGAMLSAVYGLNTGIPYLQNWLRGPKWLPWVVGILPLLLFSGASSAFGGYALPRFAQITVTSYYATSSASHHWVSRVAHRRFSYFSDR